MSELKRLQQIFKAMRNMVKRDKLEYWPNLGRYLPTSFKGNPQNFPMVTSKEQARKMRLIY
jgi:hypothetical protein